MFDLNNSVGAWRENLAAEGVYGTSDLDELESHLREEISKLTGRALSEQEAFEVACLRMGDAKVMSREFAKVNTGMVFKRRLFWMCAGILAYDFIAKLAHFLSGGVIWAGAVTGFEDGIMLIILSTLIYFTTLVLAILVLLVMVRRYRPRIISAWLQSGRGKIFLFAGLSLVYLVLWIVPIFNMAGTARILTSSTLGKILSVTLLFKDIWGLIGALILIGAVLKLSNMFVNNSRSYF
jgi:hypothetical protein